MSNNYVKNARHGEFLRVSVDRAMVRALDAGKISQEQLNNARTIRWPARAKILGSSTKVQKSVKENTLTAIVYLSPEKESVPYGGANLCPLASLGCIGACLGVNCARLRMSAGRNSKLWKSLLWVYCPTIFIELLIDDIAKHERRAANLGLACSVRLNGTSDILWEREAPYLFEQFPDVVFYDYTKIAGNDARRFKPGNLPANYSLTFSRSESNGYTVAEVLQVGGNVAVVFADLAKAVRDGWSIGPVGKLWPVFDGDTTDYRPSDPRGVVVGLAIKGNATDDTGFIIQNQEN